MLMLKKQQPPVASSGTTEKVTVTTSIVMNPMSFGFGARGAVPAGPTPPAAVPDLDESDIPEGIPVDVSHVPAGIAVPRANEATFRINDKKFCIPIGQNTVKVSDTEIEMYRSESPFNIKFCAGRASENTHMSSIKLMRHSLGARPPSVLYLYILISALLGVIIAFAAIDDSKGPDARRDGGIGAGVGIFIPLFIAWFLDRKAYFGYETTSPEGSPIGPAIAPEGIKVSQFKIESLLKVSWERWSRFRCFTPTSPFHPLQVTENPLAKPNTNLIMRSCGTPAGADTLSIVDNHAVMIRKTRGLCNWPIFASSVWEGFWLDDVLWTHYSLGGRTRRGFFGAIAVSAGVGAGIAFGAYDGKQRDAGDATGPAAAAGVCTALVLLARWFLSAKTSIQFGIADHISPEVGVPRGSSSETFDEVTKVMFRRDIAKESEAALTRGGAICGKDTDGNQVELSVTPDVTEIRIFQGAKTACEKFICRLCTDQSYYRCKTKDLVFVYSSTASIVAAMVQSVAIAVIGILVTVLLVPQIEKTPAAIDEGKQNGIGISIALCIANIIYAFCTRKSVVVLGTPLAKPMPAIARALNALGFLPPAVKFMYRVEFVALTFTPEETVSVLSHAVRAAKEKCHPVDQTPFPVIVGVVGAGKDDAAVAAAAADAQRAATHAKQMKGNNHHQQQQQQQNGMMMTSGGGGGHHHFNPHAPMHDAQHPHYVNGIAHFNPHAPATGHGMHAADMGMNMGMGTTSTTTTTTMITSEDPVMASRSSDSTASTSTTTVIVTNAGAADVAAAVKMANGNTTGSIAPLPPGWEELKTDDGEIYYFAEETDESSWDRPTAPPKKKEKKKSSSSSSSNKKKLPPGWEELKTDDGEIYYFNDETGESSWDWPEA